jgi:hypothetical protein
LIEHDTAADVRCIITKVKWFLTGDTNDPDSDTVAQIGWFKILKAYIPKVDFQNRGSSPITPTQHQKALHR